MFYLSGSDVGVDSSMKKFDIEKSLKDKNYKEFKPTSFDDECITKCYQSAIRNEDDKRDYFINWKKWDFSKYNYMRRPELNEPRFEADTQLTTKNEKTIEILFFNGWEPEEVEEFMKKLFETGWFKGYDED